MRSPDGQYYLDMETQIAPRQFSFDMPLDMLWADRQQLRMDGRTYETLSIENLMLILCVHGTKHLWERLIWVVDVATLLRKRKDLNVPKLLEMATSCGGLRMLLVGLEIAREVTGESLPAEADEAVRRDPTVAQLAHAAITWALGNLTASPSLREKIAFNFAVRERVRDRLRCGLLNLFMPTYSDWNAFSLPERLFPLYYITRPFRLLGKFVSITCR